MTDKSLSLVLGVGKILRMSFVVQKQFLSHLSPSHVSKLFHFENSEEEWVWSSSECNMEFKKTVNANK